MAIAVMQQPIHLAWGSGSAAWDSVPVLESISDSALVAEIGRHKATVARYCTPDPAGNIVVSEGRFLESSAPTNHLYMRFDFDYEDAPTAAIREVAVYLGTETNPALPPGQVYFHPADIVHAGTLFMLERFPRFDRSPAVRQSFEFVATI